MRQFFETMLSANLFAQLLYPLAVELDDPACCNADKVIAGLSAGYDLIIAPLAVQEDLLEDPSVLEVGERPVGRRSAYAMPQLFQFTNELICLEKTVLPKNRVKNHRASGVNFSR